MQIEVWSDVVCPWCYIGKRRLEQALARFEHRDEVEVVWRSFQLDPSYPKDASEPVYQALARKFGGTVEDARQLTGRVSALAAQVGLTYDFDRAVMGNTFDAHRLTQLARARGLGEQAHERLLRAHFAEGEALADTGTLVRLGADIGLPEEESRPVLAGDGWARAVEDDLATARMLGINAVPFFVLDRTYGISGAQPLEVFMTTLRTAHDHAAETAR